MDYTVIRSRRKTIAVEITKEGGVLVRAPLKLARREVLAFVHQNRGWITRKLAQARELQEERTPRRFGEGDVFSFMGEQHRLRYVAGGEYLRKVNGEFLLGAELSSRAADLFRTWYRARAREILEDRVAQFALRMGLTCRSVLEAYRFGSTPSTLVISSEGRILKSWVGAYGGAVKSQIESFFNVSLPDLEPTGGPNGK